MAAERFVIAGLARARTDWFRTVASWATSGALPAEFVGCVSAEELRVQTTAGRAFSTALLDAGLPSVDRDLIALLRECGVAALFVESSGVQREWRELGAAAVLPANFTREQLLDALRATSQPIAQGHVPGSPESQPATDHAAPLAPVISVCGPGGAGASTLAIALAQGLAAARREGAGDFPVLLADLCRRADQAALHDARDIVPGVQELVEAHRNRRLDGRDVRALTFHVPERGYSLLLGLRRPSHWTAIRPRAFEVALRGLRESFSWVVADVEADLESEKDSGSIDIEERNVMARTTVAASAAVVIVGRSSLSGLAGLVRTIEELHAHGVDPGRMLPVCSQAPRSVARRAEFTRALAKLVDLPGDGLPSVLFVPRRRIDAALRDGLALPKPLVRTVTRAVQHLVDRHAEPPSASMEPVAVQPGSLGLAGH